MLFRLAALVCALGCAAASRGAVPASRDLDDSPPVVGWVERERFRQVGQEAQELYRMRLPIPDAFREHQLASHQTDSTAETQSLPAPTAPDGQQALLLDRLASDRTDSTDRMRRLPTLTAGGGQQAPLVAAVLLLAGIMAIRITVPHLAARTNTWLGLELFSPSGPAGLFSNTRAEEEAFSEFFAAFRLGLCALPSARLRAGRPCSSSLADQISTGDFRVHSNAAQAFLDKVPGQMLTLRHLLQEIGWAPNPATRQELLAELHRQVRALRNNAGLSELLAAWQVAYALEGLLDQLTDKVSNVTASTIQTVTCGVDLFEDLLLSL
jgi:hypothetical protein